MAEVLITLGILGVVIAMTLPSLISKHNEKVWLTRFKKVYTTLYQAYNRVYIDYGPAKDWGIDGSKESIERAYKMLSKYLNVGVEYGFERPHNIMHKDLYPGSGKNWIFNNTGYNFTLSDGTMIGITTAVENNLVVLVVDVNGLRGPNVLGKDTFWLSLTSKNNAPFISGYALWWMDYQLCSTEKQSGWYSGGPCSLWVIATENMDYLHRDISIDEWRKTIRPLIIKSGDDELK